MTTREQAMNAAAGQVMASLARQDARSPRDAAIASLGPDATEKQITAWVAKWRPETARENAGPEEGNEAHH